MGEARRHPVTVLWGAASSPVAERRSGPPRLAAKRRGGASLNTTSETMNIRNQLLRQAGALASSQTVRRIELAAEIGRLEARGTRDDAQNIEFETLRADLDNCSQALIRFGTYRPFQESEPNCPHCWVVGGEGTPLHADPGSDNYHCGRCGADYP